MLTRVFSGGFFEPRHLGPHAAPGFVGAPHPGGQPGHAGFYQHHLQPGKFDEHPFRDQAVQHAREAGGPGDVILQVIGRPAQIGRRMPVRTAGVNADRQIELLRHAIHRPVHPPSQRDFLHFPDQHLDEAGIGGAALDLLRREVRAVHRHHDRGAQAGVAIQPLLHHPIVDRPAKRRRQILAENRLGAVQHVADGVFRAKPVQGLSAHRVEIGAGVSLGGLPVGPRVDRRVHGEGGGVVVVALQPAHAEMGTPVIVQIRQQGSGGGQGGMDVAIDRPGRGYGHERPSL